MEKIEKQTSRQEITDKLLNGNLDDVAARVKAEGISDMEFDTILDEAFQQLMKDRSIERAMTVFQEFDMSAEKYSHDAIDKFNVLFEDKEFINAYRIGTVFSISRKRALTAGLLGLQQLFSENAINEVMQFEKNYNLLHDIDLIDVEENIRNEFVQNFERYIVRPNINQNQPKVLYTIVESLGINREYETNPLLKELYLTLTKETVDLHNRLMEADRPGEACTVMENFRLLEDNVPLDIRSQVLDAAEKGHHKQLAEYKLKEAIFLKQKYSLFMKSVNQKMDEDLAGVLKDYIVEAVLKEEPDNAVAVIEEYNIPKESIVEAMGVAVFQLMENEKYQTMIDTVRAFKVTISDPKVIKEITLRFHKVYELGNMEVAANLAYYFKLNEPRGKKAALAYWKSLLEQGKFGEAKKIRKERRLSGSAIEPVIVEVYKQLMSESRKEEAANLLQDYNINLSFTDWLFEKIKQIFGG